MGHCTNCGKENVQESKFCVDCGAFLDANMKDKCLGIEKPSEECFGLPHGGAILGLIFGFFIIVAGISLFYGFNIWNQLVPYAAILIGFLIVVGAIYGILRKPKP